MHPLTDTLCREVGIPNGSDSVALTEHLKASPTNFLDGILSTDAGVDAAIRMQERLQNHDIRIVRQLGIVQEKFCSIHISDESQPTLIALLGDCQAQSFATDIESLVFCAATSPDLPIGAIWRDDANGRILDWRNALKGKAIIAEPRPTKESVGLVISALLGLEHPNLAAPTGLNAVSAPATEIHIADPTRSLNLVQSRLFFEATSTNHPKWRFLSFYRILENAYLANIKRSLLNDFDANATGAVDSAKKKLQSEVNQLVSLMTDGNMESHFISFNSEFEVLLSNGNKYIIALDRSAHDDQLYGADVSKKSVLRFYKMRCSIAHAGTSSVIYEKFDDAPLAITALLESVEAIALKSLSISIR